MHGSTRSGGFGSAFWKISQVLMLKSLFCFIYVLLLVPKCLVCYSQSFFQTWQSSVPSKLSITSRNTACNSLSSTFYSPLSVSLSLSLKHSPQRSVFVSVLSPDNSATIMHKVGSLRVRSGWLINAHFCKLGGTNWFSEQVGRVWVLKSPDPHITIKGCASLLKEYCVEGLADRSQWTKPLWGIWWGSNIRSNGQWGNSNTRLTNPVTLSLSQSVSQWQTFGFVELALCGPAKNVSCEFCSVVSLT